MSIFSDYAHGCMDRDEFRSACAEMDREEKWYAEHGEETAEAETKTDDENELKFYYVESLDDYWVGRRLDNFYYATWHKGLGFVWSHSRYLPWGEHIVDENTLWKEHTYPSEPIEIPFTEWIVGFVKKYSAETKTGEWIKATGMMPPEFHGHHCCSECGNFANMETPFGNREDLSRFCPNCGARMKGGDDE